jgi:hypothetical protein
LLHPLSFKTDIPYDDNKTFAAKPGTGPGIRLLKENDPGNRSIETPPFFVTLGKETEDSREKWCRGFFLEPS